MKWQHVLIRTFSTLIVLTMIIQNKMRSKLLFSIENGKKKKGCYIEPGVLPFMLLCCLSYLTEASS